MKKIFTITLVFFAILTVSGFAQDKKVAVVSFYINKQIDVTEFGAPAYLAVTKLNDDPDFNLAPMLKEFHSQFFDTYSQNFPFQLLPEDQVVKNAAYKAFQPAGVAESGILEATKYIIPADGYKILLTNIGNGNAQDMLKIFDQCDGVMQVSINFKLVKYGFGGMGLVKVKAKTTMVLYNKNGDKVFSIDEDANSKGGNAMVGGIPVMTTDKIMPACQSAMDELMAALQKDMPKLIKKANAKL